MSKNTLDLVKGISFYTEQTDSQFFKDLKKLLRKLGISYIDKCCNDVFIGDAGVDNDNQTLTINPDGTISISGGNTVSLCDAVKTCETQTSLGVVTFVNNILSIPYTGEDGVTQIRTIDLSSLAVDVSIDNITYNTTTNSWVVTETDGSTFNITWNDILTDVDFCPAVKACETVTTLVDNGDGTFTFTNEQGIETTFSTGTSDLVDNGDGTYTFTNSQGTSIIITPTTNTTNGNVTTITGTGTLADPIKVDINANNDLGVQGGILQQGFPLHRYTETNQSGFQRHWYDGRFTWTYGDYSTNFNNNQIGLFRNNSAQTQRIYIDNVQSYIDASNSTRTSYFYNAPAYCSINSRLLSTGQTASISTNYNLALCSLQEVSNTSLSHQVRIEDIRNVIHRFNNGTSPQTDSRYMSFSQLILNGIPTQLFSTTQNTSTWLAKPTISGNHTVIINNNNNIPSSSTSVLDVYGDAWVFGGLWNVSDITIKENLNAFPYGLNEILKLNPIEYDIKDNLETKNIYTNKKQYGFVAQEVREVLPIAVSDFNLNYVSGQIEEEESYIDNNGESQNRIIKKDIIESARKLGVNKDIIYITLINAIKELENRIRNLENSK